MNVFRVLASAVSERGANVFVAALLGSVYVIALLCSVADLGYARDEGFYFAAARSYANWFHLLAQDPARALARPAIDEYWSVNREHPALVKLLFALSHAVFYERWGWFSEAGTAYRFPGMLMGGLAVAVIYIWGARTIGRVGGLSAAILFATLPRVFYHAHLACFDIPVAAMWLVTVYAYVRAGETNRWLWIIGAAVLYGLLLNTKHNSWLLPGALVVHWVLLQVPSIIRERKFRLQSVPKALLAMAFLGPVVFFATWPWIWFDTAQRLSEYILFHTRHDYYNMEFLGRTYWKPPMPLGYAWVMTLGTVPAVTLTLFVIGVGAATREVFRHYRPRRREASLAPAVEDLQATSAPAVATESQRVVSYVLWALCLLVSYAPWLSNQTPIFGGTKHWMTAYPFLCLFAAVGFERLRLWSRTLTVHHSVRRVFQPILFFCVVAAPLVMTARAHPWALTAYTPLVGGAPGAANLGLNRTFWGYTTGAVQDFLNGNVPLNGRVYVHDTAMQSWEMMRSDGRLRRDIRGVWAIHDSDFALYHHEPHMGRVEYQIWVNYGTTTPVHIASYDNVPVIWVYARPGFMNAHRASD